MILYFSENKGHYPIFILISVSNFKVLTKVLRWALQQGKLISFSAKYYVK